MRRPAAHTTTTAEARRVRATNQELGGSEMTTHAESNRRRPESVEQDARGSFEAGKRVRDEQLRALLKETEDWAGACSDAVNLADRAIERAEEDGDTDRARYLHSRLRQSVGARDAYTSTAKRIRAVIEG